MDPRFRRPPGYRLLPRAVEPEQTPTPVALDEAPPLAPHAEDERTLPGMPRNIFEVARANNWFISTKHKLLTFEAARQTSFDLCFAVGGRPSWWPASPPERVALVGNGIVKSDFGQEIDAHELVFRFNASAHDPPKLGERTSVHFYQQKSVLVPPLSARGVYVGDPTNPLPQGAPTEMPVLMLPSELVQYEPTLGFRVLALAMASWPSATFTLYGFGGDSHHMRVTKVDMGHQIHKEHAVLDYLEGLPGSRLRVRKDLEMTSGN